MKLRILFAVAALSLGGCSTLASFPTAVIPESIPAVAPQVCGKTAADDKLYYAAESSYNTAANVYVIALGDGLLTPELKAKAKPPLVKAYAALGLVRTAYDGCNVTTFRAQAQAVQSFSSQVTAILKR